MKYFYLLLFTATLVSACSKGGSSNTNPIATNTASITGLSRIYGIYNDDITITGTGFSTTATDNKVFFNGVPATVTSATATTLVVKVPLNAGKGNLTVSVNNGTTVLGPIFNYHNKATATAFVGSTTVGGVDGTGTAASFLNITDIATDAAGNIYVTDGDKNNIRKITPAGVVTTLAGNGSVSGNANGTGTAATFDVPSGLTVDAAGNVYVADTKNNVIRVITPAGVVSNFGGGAYVHAPTDVAIDAAGNAYVPDTQGNVINKITPAGTVTVFAGGSLIQDADGVGAAASFAAPSNITIDAAGDLYVLEKTKRRIRKITPAGAVTNFAGDTGSAQILTNFSVPLTVNVDAAGNIYVTDASPQSIHKITPAGNVTIYSAGAFSNIGTFTSIAIDATGNIYLSGNISKSIVYKLTIN